jgi:hypothetical protein
MNRKLIFALVFALSLWPLQAFERAAPARAAGAGLTFTVNVTVDGIDKVPGDGVCETDSGNGLCTVRAAIMEANAHIGDDTVQLPGDLLLLTIGGAGEDNAETGDLDITHNLTIIGVGAASTKIDGNHLDRVLHILGNATVTITGVTIQHGQVAQAGPTSNAGGGIYNNGTLTLNDSAVSENTYSGSVTGGGIFSSGSLTVNHTTIADNTASHGGGVHNSGGTLTLNDSLVTGNTAEVGCGGGIYNLAYGSATVSDTTVSDNTAAGNCGGGIFNSSGTLTLSATTVTDNKAYHIGGGIHNNDTLYVFQSTIAGNRTYGDNSVGMGGGISNVAGEVLMADSTVSGNTANRGGGVSNGYYDSTFILINSTVSGNHANEHGGGIYARPDTGDIVVTSLYNVTITGNTADYDLVGGGDGGGIYAEPGAIFNLSNSLVAKNIDATLLVPTQLKPHDCVGALTSGGYNLLGDNVGCSGLTDGQNGDKVGTGLSPLNPLLGPLAANGGATLTHALLAGSPAMDAGNVNGCVAGLNQSLTTDQRGFARPWGVRCDIGAYEAGPAYQVFVPVVVK